MKPLPPLVVLGVALVLPGMGQVLNREPTRGLTFAFFTLLLGAFTLVTAAPGVSWVGKLSGGLFVHGLAVIDAYRKARLRSSVTPAGTR